MDNIFTIMREAFSQEFYINGRSQSENLLYLDTLTEKAIAMYKEREYTYEQIADCICYLDEQIMKMLMPQYEILVLELMDIGLEWEAIQRRNFDVLKKINFSRRKLCQVLALTDKEDLFKGYIIWKVLCNWASISLADKTDIIESAYKKLDCICDSNLFIWDINVEAPISFSKLILTNWIAIQKKKRVNYQKAELWNIYEQYNKNIMYSEMFQNIECKGLWIEPSSACERIVNQIYGISMFKGTTIQTEVVSTIISWIRESDDVARQWLDTTFQYSWLLRNNLHELLESYDREKDYARNDSKEKERHMQEIAKKMTYITKLERINLNQEKRIEQLQKEILNIRNRNEQELKSLREFMFQSQKGDGVSCKQEFLDGYENINYSKVAVIGGHEKWHQKLTKELKNIIVVNIDQNIIDFSFLENIELVVFIIDYLSHSMYYRVIEKITKKQEILYINIRNINQIKQIIAEKLR